MTSKIRSIALLGLLLCFGTQAQAAGDDYVYVRMETSVGTVDLALNKTKAPITVENFLLYAEAGYYNRLVFHRVVPGRLIQGGGYTDRLYERERRAPIKNEADNGLPNKRGTIAMARNQDPNSAVSQFFINTIDNFELNHRGKELRAQWGYAVFGEVINGMGVVDIISMVPSSGQGQFDRNVPVTPILIKDVYIITMDALEVSE